jgi:hypothetical protein
MKCAIAVEIGVAVETGDPEALRSDFPVLSLVELFLGKWREQEPQPFHLHRRDDAVEEFVVVLDGKELAA